MTTTENSRDDALTDRQIISIAEKHHALHPGVDEWWEFRDRADVIAFARAILAASPASQPAAAPIDAWVAEAMRLADLHAYAGKAEDIAPNREALERHLRTRAQPAPSPADERATYGSTDFGYTFVGIDLEEGDKRLMALLVRALGTDHPAIEDMTALLFRARASSATETGAEGAKPIYQLQQVNGAWRDVTESEYRSIGCNYARIVYTAPQPAQAAMPVLTNAMRAVITNESGAYQSADDLYAALCAAADDERPAQADARVGLTADMCVAIQECIDYLRPAAKEFSDLDMGDSKHARCIRTLRALLQGANHAE